MITGIRGRGPLAFAFVVVGACHSSSATSPAAGDASATATTCYADSDCTGGLVCVSLGGANCANQGESGASGPPSECTPQTIRHVGDECAPSAWVCGSGLTCADLGLNQLHGCIVRVCVETSFCTTDHDCSPTQSCQPFSSELAPYAAVGDAGEPIPARTGVCTTRH